MDWAVRSGAVIVFSLLCLLYYLPLLFGYLLLYMYVWEDDRNTHGMDGVYAMQCRVANDYGLYMIRVVRSIMIDHGLLSESESLTRVRRSCSCIEFCGPCRLLSK